MPVSTEQILHPDRYARGDQPIELAFPNEPDVLYEDGLGEAELRVLLARLAGAKEVQAVVALGWGGDRFRAYRTPDGPALLWYAVWDDSTAADRFMRRAERGMRVSHRPGYKASIERLQLDGRPAIRYVLAPEAWPQWTKLAVPTVGTVPR